MSNLHSIIAIAYLSLFIPVHLHSQAWETFDVDEGIKPVISIDTDNNIAIAYMNEARSGWVRMALFEGDNFTIEEADRGYFYGPLDFVYSPTDIPSIVFHDHDANDGDEIFLEKIGNEWQRTIIANSGHDGWDNSIAFDSDGAAHTSSVDPSAGGVEYARRNERGWVKSSIGTPSTFYQYATSIAIDAQNNVHIAYYLDDDDNLYYLYKADDGWLSAVVDSEGGMFPSMIIDNNQNVRIAYYDQVRDDEGLIKIATLSNNNWTIETVSSLSNAPIERNGSRRITSLKQDDFGNIHLSYCDRDILVWATKENDGWVLDTVVDVRESNRQLGSQSSMVIDSEGLPHITYFEITSFTPYSGEVKYVRRTNNVDQDNDGFHSGIDCNDLISTINPDAEEIPNNNVDENCDGIIFFIDEDNDGFHSGIDCDDTDPNINPNKEEIPGNNIDENCDGEISTGATLAGIIRDVNGQPVTGVTILLSQSENRTTTTDNGGNFSFQNVNLESGATLLFSKNTNAANGVSSIDLIEVTNHILGRNEFSNSLELLSADVNLDGRISSLDLIEMTNVILGKWTEFRSSASWGFDPPQIVLANSNSASFNVFAYKIGDTNGSANPNN